MQKSRLGKAATDPDILRAHYSFADADDQAGLTGIIKLSELCEPDIVVTTGTVPHERRHAYWRLSEACTDLELWRSTQFNIATQFATDSRVINPSRIMRVAGTVSYPNTDKQRRGYISELVTMKEKVKRMSLKRIEDWDDILEPLQLPLNKPAEPFIDARPRRHIGSGLKRRKLARQHAKAGGQLGGNGATPTRKFEQSACRKIDTARVYYGRTNAKDEVQVPWLIAQGRKASQNPEKSCSKVRT